MSTTPLLDDLRDMVRIAPITRMRAPAGYVSLLTQELQDSFDGEADTLVPGDVYQVSFPGDPRHVITLEVF